MAERRLDIKVAASAAGVAETAKDVDRLAESVRRAGRAGGGLGGRQGLGGGRSGIGQFLGGFNRDAQALGLAGDASLFGLAKGAGAFLALHQLAQFMSSIPDAAKAADAAWKGFGGSIDSTTRSWSIFDRALQKSIPLIDQLGEGFVDLFDLLSGRTVAHQDWQRKFDEEGRVWKDFVQLFDRNIEATRELNIEQGIANLGPIGGAVESAREEFQKREAERQAKRVFAPGNDAEREMVEEKERLVDRARLRRAEDEAADALDAKRSQSDQRLLSLKEQLLTEIGNQIPFEKQRTQIQRETLQQDEELKRLQKERGLTVKQRRTFGGIRELLPAIERDRILNLRGPEPANRTQLQDTRFLTGVSTPLQIKIEQHTAASRKALEWLVNYFRRLPQNNPGGLISSPF